jgi:hypothetical protein
MLGALLLVLDFVAGSLVAAIVVAVMAVGVFGYFWLVLPLLWRGRAPHDEAPADHAEAVP